MNKPATRKLRCAVYTRKSSEEGLEQEFNSLDAQREACEAYVASQRSEGWVLIRDQYDGQSDTTVCAGMAAPDVCLSPRTIRRLVGVRQTYGIDT